LHFFVIAKTGRLCLLSGIIFKAATVKKQRNLCELIVKVALLWGTKLQMIVFNFLTCSAAIFIVQYQSTVYVQVIPKVLARKPRVSYSHQRKETLM